MKKKVESNNALKCIAKCIVLAVMTITLALAGCAPVPDGGGAKVTITLPPVGSAIRALTPAQVSRLQTETARYRVRANSFSRIGTGGTYTFAFAAGTKVDVTVECINASGQVIVRTVTKSLVVTRGGDNSMEFVLSKDGTEIVHEAQPEPSPSPVPTPQPQPDTPSGGNDTPSGDTPSGDNPPSPPAPVPGQVTYNGAGGGNPSDQQTYDAGNEVTLQTGEPTRAGYTFSGWTADKELKYTANAQEQTIAQGMAFVSTSSQTAVNTRITSFKMPEGGVVLTAQWIEMTELNVSAVVGDDTTGDGSSTAPFATVQKAITVAKSLTGANLSINVSGTISVTAAITFDATGKAITLTGGGTLRRDDSLTTGDMVTVSAGNVKFEQITLDGGNVASDGSVLKVSGSGTVVELASGGTIKNGINSGDGGGVSVAGATFKLTGGTIENCQAASGGGVYVGEGSNSSGIFEMENGTISGNTSTDFGGGVCTYGSSFTMSGGKITKNTVNTSRTNGGGGGVSMTLSTDKFTMNGGEISDNVSNKRGGGVQVFGTVTMNDGKITGNRAGTQGGGVYVPSPRTFTMNDGEITDNKAGTNGGGVFLAATNASASSGSVFISTFAGTDGTLSGNLANYDENNPSAAKPSDYYLMTSSGNTSVCTHANKDNWAQEQ